MENCALGCSEPTKEVIWNMTLEDGDLDLGLINEMEMWIQNSLNSLFHLYQFYVPTELPISSDFV